MATKADEFEPDWRVIERIILVALQPKMLVCEQQRGFSMAARLTVWVRDAPGGAWIVSSSAINPPEVDLHGEIRLRCRRTYRPERILFRLESVYPNLDPETGFTGFSVSGDVLVGPDEITVRPKSWTGQYNVLTWSGWV